MEDKMNEINIIVAMQELSQALVTGLDGITEEKAFIVMKLIDLKKLLAKLEKSKRKLKKDNVEIKKLNEELKSYKGFIDEKFWNNDALMYLVMSLSCGVAETLEDALKHCEEFYNL